jgi:hypothetical protein
MVRSKPPIPPENGKLVEVRENTAEQPDVWVTVKA